MSTDQSSPYNYEHNHPFPFLMRCMECRRGLAIRYILSVRLSVKRVNCDKTKEKLVQIFFISYERTFSLVFREKEWLVGEGRALLPEILGHIATALMRSRRFSVHYALSNEPKMNIVRCPYTSKGGSKTQCPKFEQ